MRIIVNKIVVTILLLWENTEKAVKIHNIQTCNVPVLYLYHREHKRESPLRGLTLFLPHYSYLHLFPEPVKWCLPTPPQSKCYHIGRILPWAAWFDTTKMFRARLLLTGAIADGLVPLLNFGKKLLKMYFSKEILAKEMSWNFSFIRIIRPHKAGACNLFCCRR